MKYLGKIYGGFTGLLSGDTYSIEKDKVFEAPDGDVPAEYGEPMEGRVVFELPDNSGVETAMIEPVKKTRKRK